MDHKDLHGLTLDLCSQAMVLNRKFHREIRKRKEWCKTLRKPKPQTHAMCYLRPNYKDWLTEKTQSWLGDIMWRQLKPNRTG